MSFLRPDLWWPMPAALFAILFLRWLTRRPAVAFTRVRLLDRANYHPSALRYLPSGIVWLALALVLLAFMKPSTPYAERVIESKGLDIVFVIDLSGSMLRPIGDTGEWLLAVGTDGPSRMNATRDALRTFITLRRDDRIGVVVFSDNAYVVCPLTFDRDHLLKYFDMLDPNTLRGEGLTAIGEGIATATSLLAHQSTPNVMNKVVIVFTDGANNAGEDPVHAIEEATRAGIRVHVVGIDLEAQRQDNPEIGRLINAVQKDGGRYFAASSKFDLTNASQVLDELEKGYLTTRTFERNESMVRWFALGALALLGLALILRALPVFVALH